MSKLLPPKGLPRAIAFQSAVIAVGSGTFMTGSVVFFTRVLGLTPVQIGIGLSLAGLVGLAGSLPLGALADRLGGQRSWVIGAIAEAAGFAAYPLAHSFAAFLLLMVVTAAADAFANVGRTIYTADALPAETRVRTMAYARSYLNIGFTIGAGLGAAALALNSTSALIAMALLNTAGLLVNAFVVSRLPAITRVSTTRVTVSRLAVFRDKAYLGISLLIAVLWFHGVIFTEIIPLWTITHTDAPKPLLGALFALNTVMAVTLQVPATRAADTLGGSARLLRRGAWASAIACPIVAFSGMTHGALTIAVLALAVVLMTSTELWSSAAQWFLQTEIPPAEQRGAYVGANRMMSSAGQTVAPAGLTLLAIQTGGWGWWVIAGIFVACAFIAQPAVAWVARTRRVEDLASIGA
jgi:MFS family permease